MIARSLLPRLWRDDRGVAFVEFAFAAPVLLLMILGGLELVNYALAHLRVNQIAMTVADNAGRVVTGIDEANVHEVFAGAWVVGMPIDFEDHGRVVLSSLQDNGLTGGNAGQMINWQRCWGELDVDPAYGVEGDGRDDDELEGGMGRDGSRIVSAPDTAVMVVEVTYEYQPLIGGNWLPIGGTIRHESAFNVRGRQNNDVSNTQSLEELDCGSNGGSSGGSSGGGGSSSSSSSSSGGSTTSSSGGSASSSSGGSTSSSSGGSNGGGSNGGGSNGGGSNGGSSGWGSSGWGSSGGGGQWP